MPCCFIEIYWSQKKKNNGIRDFANMQIFLQQFSDLLKLQKEIELYDDHFGGVKNVYFWFEQMKCMIFGLSKWKMNINLPDEID